MSRWNDTVSEWWWDKKKTDQWREEIRQRPEYIRPEDFGFSEPDDYVGYIFELEQQLGANMPQDQVTVTQGQSINIVHQTGGGWTATFILAGNNKVRAFTDSVDLAMWLGDILVNSDGGKREMKPNDQTSSTRSEAVSAK